MEGTSRIYWTYCSHIPFYFDMIHREFGELLTDTPRERDVMLDMDIDMSFGLREISF